MIRGLLGQRHAVAAATQSHTSPGTCSTQLSVARRIHCRGWISRNSRCAHTLLSATVPGYRWVRRLTGMTGLICQAPLFGCFQAGFPQIALGADSCKKPCDCSGEVYQEATLNFADTVMNIPLSSSAICSESDIVATLQASYHIYYC